MPAQLDSVLGLQVQSKQQHFNAIHVTAAFTRLVKLESQRQSMRSLAARQAEEDLYQQLSPVDK